MACTLPILEQQFTPMEILFELIFQIVAELFLTFAGDGLFHFLGKGFQLVATPFRSNSLILRVAAHLVAGALMGWVSLWLFPALFIQPGWQRLANLIITPVLTGLATMGIARMRDSEEDLAPFATGFAFALAMALVRLSGAH